VTDKNGTARSLEYTLVHVSDAEKEIIACISCNINRTGDKDKLNSEKEEERLRKAEKRIEAANQRKRKFIANINHEIRTPMNAIIGYAEMLAESELGEQQRRFVDTIRKNSTSLVAIINDIMELSKLETGKVKVLKSTVKLQVVIEQLHDLFIEQSQAKSLEFFCLTEPNLPEFYVIDASHCRQVLANLLSNAVKFTDKGAITLTVTGTRVESNLYTLSFQVKDTGRGMTVEEQENLIDLFARQQENLTVHDGRCLGLTLSARLARMMGGNITLESVKGRGSSFTFNMPATAAEELAIQGFVPARHAVKRKKSKQPVILVVDDMPEMAHLVKIYFSSSLIKVLEATDRKGCLEHAFSAHPDLILMDLNLAGADGRDITRQLRADSRTKDIPIVVMTGLMLDKSTYQPLFDDFLAKPFHLHELQHLVDKYIQVEKNNTEVSRAKNAPPPLDVARIRSSWNDELEALYTEAEMSGSLDAASALGQKMLERGVLIKTEELTALGEKLKRFALNLDIQGVEQILSALQEITGKSR
jgi:CheY-like chemotaxis protein